MHVDGITSFVGNEATDNGGMSRLAPPLGRRTCTSSPPRPIDISRLWRTVPFVLFCDEEI